MTSCSPMHEAAGLHPARAAPAARNGRLSLRFVRSPAGRTFIGRQFSSYPFHVGRPFYLDQGRAAGMATLYVQSCSGGLYTEDDLRTDMHVGAGAQAHLTTQASTIVHRGTRGPARQTVRISAAEDALVEYLPDAAILFPGASLEAALRLDIADGASAILFDSFLAHDFGSGTGVFDSFANSVQICRPGGHPLATDRFQVRGRDFAAGAVGQMGRFACHGSVLVIAPGADIASLVAEGRAAVSGIEGAMTGISVLPGGIGISARTLSADAIAMRRTMIRIWQLARLAIAGKAPGPRRK